jgi:flagellar biosynthesis chaperone FliJ
MEDQAFNYVISRYQQNLTDLKVTGNTALGYAVDMDKKWLDSYVATLEQKSQQQQAIIQKFMKDYQNTNPELVEMQGKMKEIRAKGPMLQDAYETEKQAEEQEPMDFTPYYVKAGLIVGVGAVVWLVGVFRPVYMR